MAATAAMPAASGKRYLDDRGYADYIIRWAMTLEYRRAMLKWLAQELGDEFAQRVRDLVIAGWKGRARPGVKPACRVHASTARAVT